MEEIKTLLDLINAMLTGDSVSYMDSQFSGTVRSIERTDVYVVVHIRPDMPDRIGTDDFVKLYEPCADTLVGKGFYPKKEVPMPTEARDI